MPEFHPSFSIKGGLGVMKYDYNLLEIKKVSIREDR
jgi:hypothetical protein